MLESLPEVEERRAGRVAVLQVRDLPAYHDGRDGNVRVQLPVPTPAGARPLDVVAHVFVGVDLCLASRVVEVDDNVIDSFVLVEVDGHTDGRGATRDVAWAGVPAPVGAFGERGVAGPITEAAEAEVAIDAVALGGDLEQRRDGHVSLSALLLHIVAATEIMSDCHKLGGRKLRGETAAHAGVGRSGFGGRDFANSSAAGIDSGHLQSSEQGGKENDR